MAFVPKRKMYKIRWKVALPLLLLLVLIVYTLVNVFLPPAEEEKKFTVCNLGEKETVELLNKKSAETFVVNDYTYYGESLGLYTSAYGPESDDQATGKTMQLHNLCTDKTITLTVNKEVDQKIALNDLDPGFYELIIIDNLVEKRVTYKDTFTSEAFYTVKRDNAVKKVTMVADKALLKDYDITLNDNYLFLNVEKKKPSKEKIDVYLDPYGMSTDFQYVPDKGSTGNGLSEYQEMYDAAVVMKKQLESYGLRVEISRKDADSEADKAYGENGRFAQAIKKDAKYYVMLRMNKSESTGLRGAEIWHSSYVSDVLAKNMMYTLQKELNVTASNYLSEDDGGVGASAIDKEYFDNNLYLRETGGKATFAALYSDLAKEQNASFKDANGMYALEFDFGYVSNSEDAQFWKTNKEAYAKQVAISFAQAIGIIK
ncbi:MAG: N-acetylmuramoyl-L-alanine amidase [Longicatena sp.]